MSCFGGKEQLLYLLELTVETVKLSQDKIDDVKDCTLMVKIKLIDFPVFEVSRQDFNYVKPHQHNQDETLEFFMGKCCLFTKQPRDLMQMIQSTPMKIGIFCAGDSFPIAETEIPLSGCLCDQITMASNDNENLPKPFIIKGGFNLLDPGRNPSGAVNIYLKLKCLGKNFATQYKICPKSFLFKCQNDSDEYCVKQVLPSGEDPETIDLMQTGQNLLSEIQRDCFESKIKKREGKRNKKDKKKKKKG